MPFGRWTSGKSVFAVIWQDNLFYLILWKLSRVNSLFHASNEAFASVLLWLSSCPWIQQATLDRGQNNWTLFMIISTVGPIFLCVNWCIIVCSVSLFAQSLVILTGSVITYNQSLWAFALILSIEQCHSRCWLYVKICTDNFFLFCQANM